MKKAFFIVFFLLANSFYSYGQNLVLNPGFDQFITCPSFGQFGTTWINDWQKPTIGSSDYYNFNCPGIQPVKQTPHSSEGYAGIICYNFGTEYREYITGEFSSPLVAGTTYEIEFYVSLNDGYIQAIEEVDAYISTTSPGPFSNTLHIAVTPQITNQTGALNDTSSWTKISGNFLALGGEQFITIGNFNDDNNTTITQPGSVGSFGAYYFVDDVSVIPLNTTGVGENKFDNWVQLYHAGNGIIKLKLDFRFPISESLKIICYDIRGKQYMNTPITKREEQFALEKYPDGVYIIEVTDMDDIRVFRKFYK
jgi:OmpA-OmpF porin, OOP family